jgi:hypothetical protein
MASGYPYPSPIGLDPSGAKLSVNTDVTFDTGNPLVDRASKQALSMVDVAYDQVFDISIDLPTNKADNDIGSPSLSNLASIWQAVHDPANVYAVAYLLTVEFGYAGIYIVNGLPDFPDIDAFLPVPLVPGGFFFHMDDNDYEVASNWHGNPDVPINVQGIFAAAFEPTRITGRVFLKNKGV